MTEDVLPERLPTEAICSECWMSYHAALGECPVCNPDTARALT